MAARIQRQVPAAARTAPRGSAAAAQGRSQRRVRRKVPARHLVRFTRMLATLTEAGLPVLRNLNILADQWPAGRFRDAILDTAEQVEEGQPLSESLGQHPEVFGELYVNMARAGEAAGVLDQVLNRLADFQERAQAMRDRTRGALVYPSVIVVVATIIVTVLMIVVIPKFRDLFLEMDIELPWPTVALMKASDIFVGYWYVILGVPTVAFILYQAAYRRSYAFRRWNHAWFLRLPRIGSLIRTGQISRYSTTLGTLVSSGVPHLRAFEILRGALGNEVFRESVDEIRAGVREGEPIASAMESTGEFDDVVISMVEVGEETGDLDRMCMRVGANYEENFNRSLDTMLKLLEPFMLLLMAGGVGMIALAMFLPLFKLLEQLGQMG